MFLRGKEKRSEDDQSIIGDIPIRSSPQLLLADGDHYLAWEGPEKVGSFYSKIPTLITEAERK